MIPNSQRRSHVAGINENRNIISQDIPKHKQFYLNPVSSVLLNPIQNFPTSSCLATLDSSSIINELDATCGLLSSHYLNTPLSSSYLINQSGTSSTSSNCSEILNNLNYQILNNSIATYLPSINYSSTSCNNISNGVWNGDEICMQQDMNLDQNLSQFSEVMNLPNLMLNAGHGLIHSSECLSYQAWFQPSQFDQLQRMRLMLDSNFSYYGSYIIGSNFAENALAMKMGFQGGLFDIPIKSDQINKLTDRGIVDREFERKRDKKLKNRESAARSRVKKQEHVNYLEKKSWQLKKDNDLLNKELVFLRSIPRTRLHLRRTSSCEAVIS